MLLPILRLLVIYVVLIVAVIGVFNRDRIAALLFGDEPAAAAGPTEGAIGTADTEDTGGSGGSGGSDGSPPAADAPAHFNRPAPVAAPVTRMPVVEPADMNRRPAPAPVPEAPAGAGARTDAPIFPPGDLLQTPVAEPRPQPLPAPTPAPAAPTASAEPPVPAAPPAPEPTQDPAPTSDPAPAPLPAPLPAPASGPAPAPAALAPLATPVPGGTPAPPSADAPGDTAATVFPQPPAPAPAPAPMQTPKVTAPTTLPGADPELAAALKAARKAFWEGNPQAAGQQLSALAAAHPDNADIQGELGNFHFMQRKYEDAAAAYFRAGELLIAQGRIAEAEALVPVLQPIDPDLASSLADRLPDR